MTDYAGHTVVAAAATTTTQPVLTVLFSSFASFGLVVVVDVALRWKWKTDRVKE